MVWGIGTANVARNRRHGVRLPGAFSGTNPRRTTSSLCADLISDKDRWSQGWKLSLAESTRPRFVITTQPAPRLSIDFTVPAPGIISPGTTSIEPRGLSMSATPL